MQKVLIGLVLLMLLIMGYFIVSYVNLFNETNYLKEYSKYLEEGALPNTGEINFSSKDIKVTKTATGYVLELLQGEESKLNSDLLDNLSSEYFLNATNLKEGILSPELYSAIEDLEAEGYIINGKLAPSLLTATTPDLTNWTGSSSISKLGTVTSGVWNAAPITTEYIADKTIALADLARNGCSEGETIKWNNVLNRWDCATDLQSTPGSVDWAGITNKPAGLDDGDNDTVLTESQVETFVTNSAINLAIGSQVNSQTIATQNWVGSQGYLTSYTETDPTLASWTGSTNISTLGTVVSGVWNGTPITTAYIADGTIALGDLGQNGCSDGQVLKWSTSNNSWICSSDLNTGTSSLEWSSILNRPVGLDDGDDDTVLSEAQVEGYVTNAAINLATGSQVNSENIATESWVGTQGYLTSYTESDPSLATWTGSTNISTLGTILSGVWNGSAITSAYIADKTITFADIAQNSCADGQTMKWNMSLNTWVCSNDLQASSLDWTSITNRPAGLDDGDDDTVLSEAQVEAYVTNAAINLATGSQVNSENIATESWVGTQGYLTSYTESDPGLATWTGSANISTLGTVLTGVWNGSAITSAYIADGTIALGDLGQNGCSDGQVLKWSDTSSGWICATDNAGSGTVSLSAVYDKWDPDAPPANPSAYDDEFSDNINDPSWTKLGSNAVEANNVLTLSGSSTFNYKAIPSGDFSIWTKTSVSGFPQFLNYGQGLLAVQAGTGTIWSVGLGMTSTNNISIGVYQWSGFISWVSTPINYNINPINDLYLSIRRSGSTLTFWVSTDGITYNRIYTVADPGVNRMGLLKVDSSHIVVYDYFRYDPVYRDFNWLAPGRSIGMGGGVAELSPVTTQGDLIVGDANGDEARLAKGTAGQVLTMDGTGTAPVWQNPGSGLKNWAIAYGTTNISYATAAWEDMPDMIINITTTGGPIELQFSAGVGNTVSGGVSMYRLLIDDVVVGTQTKVRTASQSVGAGVSLIWMQNIAAGAHTVKVQWNSESGTTYNRADAGNEHRTLIVKEY